jgi:hypothetical protein
LVFEVMEKKVFFSSLVSSLSLSETLSLSENTLSLARARALFWSFFSARESSFESLRRKKQDTLSQKQNK